jgi:hypothetical protein
MPAGKKKFDFCGPARYNWGREQTTDLFHRSLEMAISLHKTDDAILTGEDLASLAALSADRRPEASARYVHLKTIDLQPIAEQAGWVAYNAGMKSRNRRSLAKNPAAQATAGHFLAFRPSDNWLAERDLLDRLVFHTGVTRISGAIPRLVVYNSHDTTLANKIILGLFDFICSNAAIISSEEWGQWTFRHMNIDPIKWLNFFGQVINAAPFIMDVRDELSKIEVNRQQALNLAERVIDLRWDGKKYSVDPAELIVPRFREQSALTAYNVFQTIQGHLINQGVKIQNRTNGKERKSARVKDFSKDLAINQGLWSSTNDWLISMGHQLPIPPVINVDIR